MGAEDGLNASERQGSAAPSGNMRNSASERDSGSTAISSDKDSAALAAGGQSSSSHPSSAERRISRRRSSASSERRNSAERRNDGKAVSTASTCDLAASERRVEQLKYLVREGVISEEEASNLSRLPLWSESYYFQCLYEDEHYIAVGKPFDVRIDLPTKGYSMGRKWPTELTVADWFLARSTVGQKVRFTNQLDYATSGVMLLSKSKLAGARAARAFQERDVEKEYAAIVYGSPKWETMDLQARLADIPGDFKRQVVEGDEGQSAHTEVRVEMRGTLEFPGMMEPTNVTLVRVKLHTGRRHQIRLHLAHSGHPIVGDISYGPEKAKQSPRMFLHAEVLGVPVDTPFRVDCPSHFRELVRKNG